MYIDDKYVDFFIQIKCQRVVVELVVHQDQVDCRHGAKVSLSAEVANSIKNNWSVKLFQHKVFCFIFGLFVLFVWGFSSHSRIFHSYGDVTITGEGQ